MLKGAVSPIFSVTMNSQKNIFVSMEFLKYWLRFVNNNPTSAQKLLLTRCLYWHVRVMQIHLFQLHASQIDKTILANGIVSDTMIALCCFPCICAGNPLVITIYDNVSL